MFLDGLEKNIMTSLGSESDSEEDEDDKSMFCKEDNDDFYEQLV